MATFAFDRKNKRISPTAMVFMWSGVFILLGTVLLRLPWSHRGPDIEIDFMTALFTAVSSACVAGFSVVNIHDAFSGFGQFVILLLVELGGIGIMSFASFGFQLLGRRPSLAQQSATADAIYQNDAATEFKRTFMQILQMTFLIQLAGAIVIAVTLVPTHWPSGEYGLLAWSAVFHAVSAFCNCGFTIYPGDLLDPVSGNTPFLAVLLVLVVLGNLGHIVLNEIYRLPGYIRRHVKKPFWISLHTRVALATTACVIVAGSIAIWALGAESGEGMTFGEAVFATVSGRTAGFTITRQSGLPLSSLIIVMFLMFVGGSPGSCAGGVKTTSIAIWAGRIRGSLRSEPGTTLFGFTIPPELVNRARALITVAVVWNIAGVFIFSIIHPEESLQTIIFEQVSAFGTVGMTMDFTQRLNTLGRLWVIASMLVGKLGLLSIVFYMSRAPRVSINRPFGRIMVG